MAKDKAIQVRTSLDMHNQILELLEDGETVGEFIRESVAKNIKNRLEVKEVSTSWYDLDSITKSKINKLLQECKEANDYSGLQAFEHYDRNGNRFIIRVNPVNWIATIKKNGKEIQDINLNYVEALD